MTVCLIIKQPTHKRKTHWFTTLDSLRIIIELFWGDYFAYFWLRWLYVVPPHSQAPRTTLSKGPTPVHVGLNKTHVSQAKPRLAHLATTKKHQRGSLLSPSAAHKISPNLGAKRSGSAAADSDSSDHPSINNLGRASDYYKSLKYERSMK